MSLAPPEFNCFTLNKYQNCFLKKIYVYYIFNYKNIINLSNL